MKKLRMKIVLGVFLSATVVFFLTILAFGLFSKYHLDNRYDSTTELIGNHGGILPLVNEYKDLDQDEQIRLYPYDEESPYRIRYFSVKFDDDKEIVSADVGHIAAVDTDEAVQMAETVSNNNQETGYYNDYRYRISEKNKMIIFLDCSSDIFALKILLVFFSVIALAFIIMITVVFYFLSRFIVKPFEENARMQKQFVTDASHELKTPIAIISANAEVLAYKEGENEWIHNITTQVTRISELVNELLTLNRLEEIETVADIEPVDLSEIVLKTVSSFEEVFKNKSCILKHEIQPNLILNSNQSQMERLVSVLVENASKYVSENGEVIVSLSKTQRYTILKVFNTCKIENDADFVHLFDRFYRPDSSRTSKTGGHGIGLSIAKRIADLHNGTIEALPQKNGLTFQVKLSNKLKATPHKDRLTA